MTLNLHVPEARDLKPRLTVFGVGGAGGNAVNNMISRALEGVDFVVANTDAQSLNLSDAPTKVQLGEELTEGLGAGAKPEVGARAAEETLDRITDHLMGSHMCFITAGMGGGTGTGAAPIIAQAARQMGILTVGVVTKPFMFEGSRRMNQAEDGIEELQKYVDTLIVIPNQNLFRIASEKTTFTEAFGMADDVLYQGVKGVTDLMVRPGLVNLDFADIRSVMDEMGKAMMGTGEADGDDRAIIAAERAIANPLLDEISLQGARGVLINITGGDDMTLHEVDEASNKIRNEVDPQANIIFGSTYDPEMTGRIRVSVVATGIEAETSARANPRASTKMTKAKAEEIAPQAPDLFTQSTDADPAPTAVVQDVEVADEVEVVEENSVAVEEPAQAPQTSLFEQSFVAETVDNDKGTFFEASAPEVHVATANIEQINPASLQIEEPSRVETARERMQKAAIAEPATAKPAHRVESQSTVEKSSRFSIDSMIKRMAGADESTQETSVAINPVARPEPEKLAPRRMDPQAMRPKLDDAERQRVDIPAFLRRKAN